RRESRGSRIENLRLNLSCYQFKRRRSATFLEKLTYYGYLILQALFWLQTLGLLLRLLFVSLPWPKWTITQ
ncbi:hypothetical protein M1O51_00705, partial [Dehalococcoidia bacterium]|nr:hypothetical protein [Dehalococcoidia bacterium]